MWGLNEGSWRTEGVCPSVSKHPSPCPHLLAAEAAGHSGGSRGACYGSISTSSPPLSEGGGRRSSGRRPSLAPSRVTHRRLRVQTAPQLPVFPSQEQPSGNQEGIPSFPPLWVGREAFLDQMQIGLPGCSRWDWSQQRQCLFSPGRVPGNSEGFRTRSRAPARPPARSVLAERGAMCESELACSGFTSVGPTRPEGSKGGRGVSSAGLRPPGFPPQTPHSNLDPFKASGGC